MKRTKPLTLLVVVVALGLCSCTAEIGDDCSYDIDCSPNMDRTCDSNQPSGYCLILGCEPDSCPGEAVCIEFTTPCPIKVDAPDEEIDECEQIEPNRGRTYCLRHCNKGSDCRKGYDCELPDTMDALIIDSDKNGKGVCVPNR